jgi:hypothetical protein
LLGGAGNDILATSPDGVLNDTLDGGDGNDNLSDCVNHNTFTGGTGINVCQGSRTGNASSSFTSCQMILACPAGT